jgi:hypothetical protein
MLEEKTLKKDMITETFINNLSRYHLNDLLEKVLLIKNPPKEINNKNINEEDIMKMAFDSDI